MYYNKEASMITRNVWLTLIFACVIVLYTGCSGSSSPVIPDADIPSPSISNNNNSLSSGREIWGLWHVRINAETAEAEIIPLRTAEWHVNTVTYLEKGGYSTMQLKDIIINNSSVELNVGLTHPFPGLYAWSGFDVRGIFISDGSYDNFHSDGDLTMSEPDEPKLLNADGWTRWWNPYEFPTASIPILGYVDGLYGRKNEQVHFRNTLNPYKYFSDDLTQNEEFPADMDFERRGLFLASTSLNWRHYSLDFGEISNCYDFNYAVDASHAFGPEGDGNSSPGIGEVPDPFFPIEANMPEPFAIEVDESVNTLYYKDESNWGGEIVLEIKVYDWQGMRRDDGIPAEIEELRVESPTLKGSEIITATLGPGGTENYSVYRADLTNCHPDDIYNQEILISAVSTEGSYSEGYDGYPTTYIGSNDQLVAYSIHTPVVSPNIPTQSETLTVLVPDGGESWEAGTTHDIEWSSTGVIDNVMIEFSENGTSGPWNALPGASSVPNTGSWSWTPGSGDVTSTGRIRISDATNPTVNDMSDANFEITEPTTITVISPNGGELWVAGAANDITWSAPGSINFVRIDYSLNNGGNWLTITTVTDNDGTYESWDTSGLETTQALIRIYDASDLDPYDTSDDVFSIESITVTDPNGTSDSRQVGVAENITWDTGTGGNSVITHVEIEFSKNGTSGPWSTLPGAGNVANTGSWSWTPGLSDVTTHGRIRVTDVNHTQLTDISDADFEVYEKHELTLPEYKSYFQATSQYTYRGRRTTSISSLNAYLSSSVSSWDFTSGTLGSIVGSTTFHVQTANGSNIPLYGGAPSFYSQEYGMNSVEVNWPYLPDYSGGGITPDPWWVYYFDDSPNILNPSGFSGYFDGAYMSGLGWLLLKMATHQWTLDSSSDVQFPLDADSGQDVITDDGLLYYNYSTPFAIDYSNSEFTVLSAGSVTVHDGNYPHCLLIKHKHGSINPQSNLGTIGAIMYQWVDMESGTIVAFIQSHNDTQTVRFNSNTGLFLTGRDAIIGALY